MNDQPYPPLRPQAPGRTPQAIPWPMVIVIGLLLLVAAVLLVMLLTRNDGGGTGLSPSGSAASSPAESLAGSPLPSESITPAPSGSGAAPASEAPAPTPVPIGLDTIVATTVDRLSVRAAPGVSEAKRGSLELGATSFVVGGPAEADGFRWYLLSTLGLPPNTGCAGTFETDPYNCPAWFGWVAAASEAGEPWLLPSDPGCPSPPFTAEALILARTDLERLACQGAEPFTFRAWYPEIPPDALLGGACPAAEQPSGWLVCQGINYNQVTISETEGFGGIGVRISIDPASGLSMPPRGTWVEVRVHLDDAASQGCDEAEAATGSESIPEQVVVTCRGQMVLESATAVTGP